MFPPLDDRHTCASTPLASCTLPVSCALRTATCIAMGRCVCLHLLFPSCHVVRWAACASTEARRGMCRALVGCVYWGLRGCRMVNSGRGTISPQFPTWPRHAPHPEYSGTAPPTSSPSDFGFTPTHPQKHQLLPTFVPTPHNIPSTYRTTLIF